MADVLHFPSRQAEPEVWPPVRQSYSPYPRGMAAFGEPFTPEREEVVLPWWGKLLAWAVGVWLGYVAAAGVAVLASIAW